MRQMPERHEREIQSQGSVFHTGQPWTKGPQGSDLNAGGFYLQSACPHSHFPSSFFVSQQESEQHPPFSVAVGPEHLHTSFLQFIVILLLLFWGLQGSIPTGGRRPSLTSSDAPCRQLALDPIGRGTDDPP